MSIWSRLLTINICIRISNLIYNHVFIGGKLKRKLDSMRGWVMLHEKVKFEQVKDYKFQKRDNHFRHYIQLNRWWSNEQ